MTQLLRLSHPSRLNIAPSVPAPSVTTWLTAVIASLALFALSSPAQAQQAQPGTKAADNGVATPVTPEGTPATPEGTATKAATATVPPPKPPKTTEAGKPGPESPAKRQTTDEGECFPSCRDGYLCHEGQCISACNPACGEGLQCFEGRQCVPSHSPLLYPSGVAPQYMPWPAQPAGGTNMPPPPGAWRPAYEEPTSPGAARGRSKGPRFFGYLGLQLGLGGAGRIKVSDDYFGYVPVEKTAFDLTSSTGFEGVAEFRISRYFGLGPALRLFRANANSGIGHTNNLDLLVVPTFHVPLNAVEIFFPIPIGLSFGSSPSELATQYENNIGLTAGVNVGMLAWLSKGLGMYAQFGIQSHARSLYLNGAEYVFRFHRPTLTLGLSLRD